MIEGVKIINLPKIEDPRGNFFRVLIFRNKFNES